MRQPLCTAVVVLALAAPATVAGDDVQPRVAAPATAAGDDTRLRTVDPNELGLTYGGGRFHADYVPPAPGSYALPVIDTVADHPLVDVDGRPTTLYGLKGDRLAVVAFVYTTCVEAAGCPFSLAVLHQLDRALAADRDLARHVRLLTISFDPQRDTPDRLAVVQRLHEAQSDWRFATTRNEVELEPLLVDFDQPVAKLRFPDGTWTGLYRHVLKVFLVDEANRVRNVYSVGFLNPTLVLNDLRTLLLAPSSPGQG